MSFQGILSTDCSVNSNFCEDNLVFLHYCSSDVFSGDRSYNEEGFQYHFHGNRITR